jgi:type II secretory pathway component PulK
VTVPPEHHEFAAHAERSLLVDPRPTFTALSEATGVPVDTLVHFALVRWASAGAEALMAVEPQVLRELIAARRREDWPAVAGIVDWLEAGL